MVVGCSAVNLDNLIAGWNNAVTPLLRFESGNDFVALENVQSTSHWSQIIMYGFNLVDKWLFRDLTISTWESTITNGNSGRLWELGRGFAKRFEVYNSPSRVRLLCGPTSGVGVTTGLGGMRLNSWVDCKLEPISEFSLNTVWSFEADAAPGEDACYVEDVRMVNCEVIGNISIGSVSASDRDMVCRAKNVQFVNCLAQAYVVDTTFREDEDAVHRSISFRSCVALASDSQYGTSFLTFNGSSTGFSTDSIDVQGSVLYGPLPASAGANTGLMFMYRGVAPNGFPNTGTETFDLNSYNRIIKSSDYNHVGVEDPAATNVLLCNLNESPWNYNLTDWRSNTSLDGNSSLTKGTTFDFINSDLSSPLLDLRLSAAGGGLDGSGVPLPSGVAVDADGFVRSFTAPYAGLYEFGATETPEDPVLVILQRLTRMVLRITTYS